MNTCALIDSIWKTRSSNLTYQTLRFLTISFLGFLFVVLTTQLSIPFYPVPLTGQTFGVILVGLVLGREKGLTAMAMYLTAGLMGAPVFANGAFGLAALLGPSGGYLLGFIPAAFISGYFADRGYDKQALKLALIFILANIAIFVPGLLQLGFVIGWDKPILELGFYPFVLGDLLKLAIITGLLPLTHNYFEQKAKK